MILHPFPPYRNQVVAYDLPFALPQKSKNASTRSRNLCLAPTSLYRYSGCYYSMFSVKIDIPRPYLRGPRLKKTAFFLAPLVSVYSVIVQSEQSDRIDPATSRAGVRGVRVGRVEPAGASVVRSVGAAARYTREARVRMGKKKGKKKGKKGGGFTLRGPPAEGDMRTHDQVRDAGLKMYESMSQQLFTAAAPSYVNFLYQKEQAAIAAANADKPAKKKAGGKKKGKKGKKKGVRAPCFCVWLRRVFCWVFSCTCMFCSPRALTPSDPTHAHAHTTRTQPLDPCRKRRRKSESPPKPALYTTNKSNISFFSRVFFALFQLSCLRSFPTDCTVRTRTVALVLTSLG